jgi:hypothetical protein
MKEEKLFRIISKESKFATRYFTFKYQELPTVTNYRINLNQDNFIEGLKTLYPDSVLKCSRNKSYQAMSSDKWKLEDEYIFCEIKPELVLQYEDNELTLCFGDSITAGERETLHNFILKNKAPKKDMQNKFYMINKQDYGFGLFDFDIKKTDVNNIGDNYNDDLVKITPEIKRFLNEKNTSGIILFHGVPGGGKTSYIRSLISECEARFIYVPNNLFTYISNPEFIAFISRYPNSVIILEDCEELLKPREQNQSGTGISNLLNLGDGLLGDALKLKIICTFNSSLAKVDEALLRKGRLVYRYEFGPLVPEKVNGLLEKLELEKRVSEPLTLAEVFNLSHNNNNSFEKHKTIGFAG